MEDFEAAVLIEFDASTSALNPTLKERARAYLQQQQQQDGHWKLCLDAFAATERYEVQFWCLKSLLQIKQTLMSWVVGTDGSPALSLRLPPFIKNKLAHVLVTIVQAEYPARWPGFFREFVASTDGGAHVADMFLRVLGSLDEDVISLDIPRSEEESRASMALKDALRERDIADIARVWGRLVLQYHRASPPLAVLALDSIRRYTNWVDIGLVANPEFVTVLFGILSEGSDDVKCAAADCLSEILVKRMEAQAKLRLIQQLNVVAMCATWHSTPQEDEDVRAKFSGLLNVLACEIIESWKKLENHIISMEALGLEVDASISAEVQSSCEAASAMIMTLLPAVFRTLQFQDASVSLACAPFLTSYIVRLKNQQKRQGELPSDSVHCLCLILQGVAVAARFSDDSSVYGGVAADQTAEVLSQEEEAAVAALRGDLFVIFRNSAKLVPQQAIAFVHGLLTHALSGGPVTFQEVEIAITCLYELGEGLVEQTNDAQCGLFGPSVKLLMSAPVPHAAHRLVSTALLESYVRYVKVAASNVDLVPNVMRAFLGETGLAHVNVPLSTRACYLFMRIVKVLRQNLKAYLPELISGLVPRLQLIVTNPVTASEGLLKGTHGKGAPAATTQLDDRLYAWEAMSLLLALDDISRDAQKACVQGLLQDLCTQISSNLEGDLSEIAVAGGSPPSAAAAAFAGGGGWGRHVPPSKTALINQALEAISRLSKGFSQNALTKARPQIGALFREAMSVALQVPQRVPRNKLLRSRFISYLHRMVECLGNETLCYLPLALLALLHADCDAADISDVLRLVIQLMTKFRAQLSDLLQQLLPALIARVHTMLGPDWDWSGAVAAKQRALTGGSAGGIVEDLRELYDLQATYHSLLHGVGANGLLSTVAASKDALALVMDAQIKGASTHTDSGVRKICLQSLGKMLEAWQSDEGFRQIALKRFGAEACLAGLLGGRVDIRDAGSLGLLQETAQQLIALHKAYGDAFLADVQPLAQAALPANAVPEEAWRAVVQDVAAQDVRKLKETLKGVLRAQVGAGAQNRFQATAAAQ